MRQALVQGARGVSGESDLCFSRTREIASTIDIQFNVSNTLPDTVLEQVSVVMQSAPDSGLTEDLIMPIPLLTAAESPKTVYVSFTRDDPSEYTLASFQCALKFTSKELDPLNGEPEEEGYEDEYQLEEVELGAGGDYIIPSYANFSADWERLRTGSTATETFALSAMDSIKGEGMFRLRHGSLLTRSAQLLWIPSLRF